MDLRRLTTFLHVAELGSLSRAAERLRIAQPALGRQIRLLEEELGVSLCARHGRGMALTAAGQLLADRAAAILRLVEDARAEVSAERGAVRGSVSLGVPPTAGEVIAGRLVERFLRDYPEVTVRIVPAFSGFVLEMLQRGEIDLAVMYESGATRQVRSEPLIEETLYIVGPPDSPFAGGPPAGFAALAGRPLILPGSRHGLRALLETEAGRRGVPLRVTVEADALQTLKDLVARGLGHTVLPVAAVRAEVQAGVLVAVPIADPPLTRRLVLARSISRPASRAVRVFADTVKDETAGMVRDGDWPGTVLSGRA